MLSLPGGVLMSHTDQLRAMIATMLMVPEAEVRPETSLAGLNTSLGSARIRLGLKRLGFNAPAAPAATFGGLVAAVTGDGTSPVVPTGSTTAARGVQAPGAGAEGLGSLQVGLDVEDIRALPEAADYWEHEFYSGTFARSEIAYAVVLAEPRVHLAGFWCAKEALRKCDSAFSRMELNQIAVAHDAGGRPYLTRMGPDGAQRLPHAVSISHTTEVATAVVVASASAATALVPAPTTAPTRPILEQETVAREAKPVVAKRSGLARFLGV